MAEITTSADIFWPQMDPAHQRLEFFSSEGLSGDIFREKYAWNGEENIDQLAARVSAAVNVKDPDRSFPGKVYHAIRNGLFIPAGRIMAGAGTSKIVTLMNCYVNKTIEDSLVDIMEGNKIQALTGQMGGGIGTSFHTIRPRGAWLNRTQAMASGPIPFMKMWDQTCAAIESAGQRRGAMMGTLTDSHPDLPEFITVKQKPGVLTNFNLSILVSDAFMEAVQDDATWMLYFPAKPAPGFRDPALEDEDFEIDGVKQYVYSVWRARDLWEMITRNTFEYSEPGLIFIDRVNDINNLHYCEEIMCTNPCGEQPLPPNGTCNLGHGNLARMVMNPFTDRASINWDLLKQIVHLGMRFLDNVIDVTLYPMAAQAEEEYNKRRTGLGMMGVADMLAQMKLRYGSYKAAQLCDQVQKFIAIESYRASIELAKERGSFPLFDLEGLLAPNTFISQRMPQDVIEGIKKHGLRNGVLMSYAPTGTSNMPFGQPSTGLEPVFAHHGQRKVRQRNQDEWKTYDTSSYVSALFRSLNPQWDGPYPNYMPEAGDLAVEDHIGIQAAIQRWVDASVSKTVNVPEEYSYEEFARVYNLAYASGCKGCTTYRPSEVRGSILLTGKEKAKGNTASPDVDRRVRSNPLVGRTYKISWPSRDSALYLTINDDVEGQPFEVLITSKDARDSEWTTALTLMITGILRKGGDVAFVANELMAVQSVYDHTFLEGRHFGSLPAYIGYILGKHLGLPQDPEPKLEAAPVSTEPAKDVIRLTAKGKICPQCSQPSLIREDGCEKCTNCTYSKCG